VGDGFRAPSKTYRKDAWNVEPQAFSQRSERYTVAENALGVGNKRLGDEENSEGTYVRLHADLVKSG
jgi:hypothetical protein